MNLSLYARLLYFIRTHQSLLYATLNQVILSVGSALIVVLLARFFSPQIFGDIRYLIAVFAILSFWSLPGIGQVLSHKARALSRESYWHMVRSQYIWGAGSIVGACVVAVYHFFAEKPELALACVVGGLITPLSNLYLIPGLVLAGTKRFVFKLLVDASIIGGTVCGVVFVGFYAETTTGIVVGYLGTQALLTLIALIGVSVTLPHITTYTIPETQQDALFGRHLSLIQLPLALLPAIEKILVYLILGPLALATYVVTTLPIEHFKNAFKNLIQSYMLPHIEHDELGRSLFSWLKVGYLLISAGTAALILLIEYGMPFLFPHFEEAKFFARVLLISVILYPTLIITLYWIQDRNRRALETYTQIATITHILILVSLAIPFGLPGVIFAKIANEITSGILIFFIHYAREEKV